LGFAEFCMSSSQCSTDGFDIATIHNALKKMRQKGFVGRAHHPGDGGDLGDADLGAGDADSGVGDADSGAGDTNSGVGDADSRAGAVRRRVLSDSDMGRY
jgi:hypothetical protein